MFFVRLMKFKEFTTPRFIIIVVFLCLLKIFFCSFLYEHDSSDSLVLSSSKFKFTNQFFYCGDDNEVVNTVVYLKKTGKILTDSPFHSFIKPRLRNAEPYLSAFRPKAIVYLQLFTISLYEKYTGNNIDTPNSEYMYDYLNYYGILLYFITILFFGLSVYFFYQTLLLYEIEKIICQYGTFAYILIPSIFIFVGHMDSWENIALSCEIIFFYFILSEWKYGNLKKKLWYHLAPFLVLISLFRPHLLMTFSALCGFIILCFLFKKYFKKISFLRWANIQTAVLSLMLLIIAHIPILIQNKNYFGSYFISTQSKFEFFQGHNPFAKSSWNPNLYTSHTAYFDSVFRAKNIVSLNEFEEANLYSEMATDWIKKHPLQEFLLDAKKIAGYFIPYNHNNNKFNIYTLLLECAFFAFSLVYFIKNIKRKFNDFILDSLLLIPVIMSILLTVLFFVGYRWRYYAEPFFLIMGLVLINNYIKSLLNKKFI